MRYKDLISSNQIFALFAKLLEGTKVIIFNLLIARFYGPETFGKFAYVLSVISIVAVFAEFRLQSILIKEYSSKRIELNLLLGSALSINTFFAMVGFLLVLIFSSTHDDEILKSALVIYSLSFFYKIPRLFRGYFISIEKNILIAKCEVIATFVTMITLLFVIYNNLDIRYIAVSRTVDFLILSVFFIIFFNITKKEAFKVRVNRKVVSDLVLKSAPLVLSGAAMILFQRIDIIFIKHFIDDQHAGLYASATNIMALFSLIPLVVSESLAPKLFKHVDPKTKDALERKFFLMIISIGFLLSILMFLVGDILVTIIYGEQFVASVKSLQILSVSPILISLGSVAGQIIVSDNSQNWAYVKSIAACIITIISNLILIPYYGIEGAAASTILGLFVANFISHLFIKKYKRIFILQCSTMFRLITLPVSLLKRKAKNDRI